MHVGQLRVRCGDIRCVLLLPCRLPVEASPVVCALAEVVEGSGVGVQVWVTSPVGACPDTRRYAARVMSLISTGWSQVGLDSLAGSHTT